MIDTHSHLFDPSFENDLETCIQNCMVHNVKKIILVGFSHKTNEIAYDYSQKYKVFYPTAGLHPSEATKNYSKDVCILKEFLKRHRVYAIGECGLDYHYGKDNELEQKKLFEEQIQLAIELDLPLIVHMRDATKDTFDLLSKYKGQVRGVMHCFSGSLEMAKEFIKLGFYISLGGPVTFKNAKESKKIAAELDIDKLLIETDCPYLAPVPKRGERNESSYVVYVLDEIAKLRQIDKDELEIILERNTENLFKLEA